LPPFPMAKKSRRHQEEEEETMAIRVHLIAEDGKAWKSI
jgi:hypothetical protein